MNDGFLTYVCPECGLRGNWAELAVRSDVIMDGEEPLHECAYRVRICTPKTLFRRLASFLLGPGVRVLGECVRMIRIDRPQVCS